LTEAGKRRVFVMRHCQYRHADGRLSEQGRRQAEAAAAGLRDERIGLILHSPSIRCEETALIVWTELERAPGIASVEWLGEDARLGPDWPGRLGDGGILLVTHAPVIRQLTHAAGAAGHGEVTRLK
jgi:broad specificity phosphatase PhoE